jgi:dipeptidyl aminopeptidase/acylaminoacyl peptidase
MNPDDRFDRSVSDWLRLDSEHRVPDHIEAVLLQTRARRQRPAWMSLDRWLPAPITARRALLARPTQLRTLAGLALLALLIAALVALAVGSRRPLPPPYGLARNGAIVTSVDGDIYSIDPTTGKSTPLIVNDTVDFGPVFSRDGTKLLFLRSPNVIPSPGLLIVIADSDGSAPREVTAPVDGLDQVDWSPDGTRIVFLSRVLGRGLINIVNVDGTGLKTLEVGRPANQVSWLPPSGDEILFRGEHLLDRDPPAGIYAVRPDGSGIHPLSLRPPTDKNDYNDVSASPDGTFVAYRGVDLDGQFRLHLLDLRSGSDRIVTEPGGAVGSGGGIFSPDGQKILYLRWYSDSSTQLVLAPVDGNGAWIALGPPGPLGPDGPTINNYGFTPDGTAVIANYDIDKVERLLPVDGSPGSDLIHGSLAFMAYQRLAP